MAARHKQSGQQQNDGGGDFFHFHAAWKAKVRPDVKMRQNQTLLPPPCPKNKRTVSNPASIGVVENQEALAILDREPQAVGRGAHEFFLAVEGDVQRVISAEDR